MKTDQFKMLTRQTMFTGNFDNNMSQQHFSGKIFSAKTDFDKMIYKIQQAIICMGGHL